MNIRELKSYKNQSNKIAVLTCYDASFAKVLTECGIDIILIGDSLGMSISGFKSTLNVSMKQMLYHTASVFRGIESSTVKNKPLIITDMPWGSFSNPKKALKNAMDFVRNGAVMVKLEGAGENEIKSIKLLRNNSIPVCAHIGLVPQSITMTGGFIRQGGDDESAKLIFEQALKLDEAGVEMMVLECIPSSLAEKITKSVKASVIGIGTYSPCDGQVLVLYDILGVSSKQLKFSKNFLENTGSVKQAIQTYIQEVKDLSFPNKNLEQ